VGEIMSDLNEALLVLVRAEAERLLDERLRPIEQRLARLEAEADPWMRIERAAAYVDISPNALRARARRGTVVARKDDSGRWLFHRDLLIHGDGYHAGGHQQDGPARLHPPGPGTEGTISDA
jgi:hypothetical protein